MVNPLNQKAEGKNGLVVGLDLSRLNYAVQKLPTGTDLFKSAVSFSLLILIRSRDSFCFCLSGTASRKGLPRLPVCAQHAERDPDGYRDAEIADQY
jgi:hypothetical protein